MKKKKILNDASTAVSDLQAPPQHLDSGRRALPTLTHLHNFQSVITAPARIPRPVIAAVLGVAFGFLLDALCAVDSDARISIEEVDVGLLAADKGALARVAVGCRNSLGMHRCYMGLRNWRGRGVALVSRSASRVVARGPGDCMCTDRTSISRG